MGHLLKFRWLCVQEQPATAFVSNPAEAAKIVH